jgi:hypothetical protein
MRIERGGVSASGVIEQIGLVLALGASVLAAVVSAPGRRPGDTLRRAVACDD